MHFVGEGSDVRVRVVGVRDESDRAIGLARPIVALAPCRLDEAAAAHERKHVCQLAGNARHAAIGTDLDGGFGKEQSPLDLDTIADLQRLPDLLRQRGYGTEAIEGILYRNWLRFFREAWHGR